MNPNRVSLNVILDRSLSMMTLRDQTIEGFNTFLRKQREEPGEATFTLAVFNHLYHLVHDAVPVQLVPALSRETYVPEGNTALHDAMGRTFEATGKRLAALPEAERPGRVLFLIISDGEENSSREFGAARIAAMIKHQRDLYRWDFVFLGAEEAAIAHAQRDLGIPNAHVYLASVQGTKALYNNVSEGVSSYRSGGDAKNIGSGAKP